jgi:DNA end-binding protein Ku
MAIRSSWEGFLKLSLVSVPVRAYNAAVPGGGDVHFHLIHKGCGERIRYQKVCPVHGEVDKDEIVSGYEHAKDQYVEFAPEEIAKLRAQNDQSINIDAFVSPDTIDPIYLEGRTFFLVPDGPAGQKPYLLLHQIMKEKHRDAVASIILSGHEEVVLVRPLAKLLCMTVLYLENQIKKTTDFEDELGDAKISAQELKLAGALVDASTSDKVDFSHYKDQYTERTKEVIEAKLAGKEMPGKSAEKGAPIINLMDALRESVKQKQGTKRKPGWHPPRPAATHGRRKTG